MSDPVQSLLSQGHLASYTNMLSTYFGTPFQDMAAWFLPYHRTLGLWKRSPAIIIGAAQRESTI